MNSIFFCSQQNKLITSSSALVVHCIYTSFSIFCTTATVQPWITSYYLDQSRVSVFSLHHQDSPTMPSVQSIFSDAIPCVSMCLLVGCFLIRLLMCPYFLKNKPISVHIFSLTINPLSYTIKIMRTHLVLRVLDTE